MYGGARLDREIDGSDAQRFAQAWDEVVDAWGRRDDAGTLVALRRWIEIWDVCFWKSDFEAFPHAYHPDVVLENHTRMRGLAIFQGGAGIQAFRNLREDAADALSWFRFQIESAERSENRVAALGTMRTRGRLSGIGFRLPFATIWTIDDGKISRAEGFTSRRRAVRHLRGHESA